jgi:hypothetical protein
MEPTMKATFSPALLAIAVLGNAASSLADDRVQKFRSGGCDVERKYESSGKYESKVECKPGSRFAPIASGSGKEELRQRGCEVKREWKQDGGYKEEIKCE